LIPQAVFDIDNEPVTDVHVYLGTWPFTIDADDRSFESIRGGIDPSNIPIQVYVFGGDKMDDARETEN
jgi:hypothetical protein